MPKFDGKLNSNEIFAALFNMIISQEVFTNNINDTYADLVDRMRVDGSLYGDTKLYYSTDVLKSVPWGADAEATNLLQLHRPPAPACQAIVLNVFRQICLTVDNYLSKRAWGDEYAFSQFNSVMLDWVRETKKVYDSTIMNTYIGTTESAVGRQIEIITLPTDDNAEAQARLQAQIIAYTMANILVDIRDITRDYNDNEFLRSFSPKNLIVVWNSEWKNKITKLDLPTIFHKNELFEKVDEYTLPARYFGTINASAGTVPASNTRIRSLLEVDYTVGTTVTHVFPGDLLPAGATYQANSTYVQDSNIICKIIHDRSVPYMSAFEVATSFFNPKSLTETKYLTYGHNTLEYLQNFPFVTVKATTPAAEVATQSAAKSSKKSTPAEDVTDTQGETTK